MQNSGDNFVSEYESTPNVVTSKVSKALLNSDRIWHVKRELVDSPKKVALFYFASSIFGYFVSLVICAQNGVGVLPLSYSVAGSMHTLPWPLCPIFCGFIFTGVPQLLTRLFFSKFQKRYLFCKLVWIIALVPLVGVSCIWLWHDPGFFEHVGHISEVHFSYGAWMAFWVLGAFCGVMGFEMRNFALAFRFNKDK